MGSHDLSVDEVAATLRPVDSIGLPLGPGQPVDLIHTLGRRTDWERLEVLSAMLVDFYELPNRPGVRILSTFFGPAERLYREQGADIEFVPSDFRRWSLLYEARSPRVMATVARPPDGDGWCGLSLHSGATVDELHRAGADADRLLIAELNEAFPSTFGVEDHPHRLHIDEIDLAYRSSRPPTVLDDGPTGDVELAIAGHARRFIRDGSTLQTGFGAVPSTIATALAQGEGGDYGIHSEMFTTGLMRLHEAGKISNAHKTIFDGTSVTTFAAGTPELYEWIDGNADITFLPVGIVNDPDVISRNRSLVAINGAIAIDLAGQVAAESIAGMQYSGIGGHEDFLAGAGIEAEDRSLICVPSTAVLGGVPVSRIVDALTAPWLVTTPRHQVDVVITEHGIAELEGRTVRERALALASIADPLFRDELMDVATR